MSRTDGANGEEKRIWAELSTSSDEDTATASVRGKHELELDEPSWVPIGNDTAPCPVDYLVVAAAGCQLEVLKQCFEKARVEEYDIEIVAERRRAHAEAAPDPFPEHTSLRIPELTLELKVETTSEFEPRVKRCVDVCEDACIVSRSLEAGITTSITKSLTVSDS